MVVLKFSVPPTSYDDERDLFKELLDALGKGGEHTEIAKDFIEEASSLEKKLERLSAVLSYAMLRHDRELLRILIDLKPPLRHFVDAHILEAWRMILFLDSLKDKDIRSLLTSIILFRIGMCPAYFWKNDRFDPYKYKYFSLLWRTGNEPIILPSSLLCHLIIGNFCQYENLLKELKRRFGEEIRREEPNSDMYRPLYTYVSEGIDGIYRAMLLDDPAQRHAGFHQLYRHLGKAYPYTYILLYLYADTKGKFRNSVEREAQRILKDYETLYRGRLGADYLQRWRRRYEWIHRLWESTPYRIVTEIFKLRKIANMAKEIFLFWTFYLLRTGENTDFPYWFNFNFNCEEGPALMYKNLPCITANRSTLRCGDLHSRNDNRYKPAAVKVYAYLILSFYSEGFNYRRGVDISLFQKDWNFNDRWTEWVDFIVNRGKSQGLRKMIAEDAKVAESTVNDIISRAVNGKGKSLVKHLIARNNLIPNALLACHPVCENEDWRKAICEWMEGFQKKYYHYLIREHWQRSEGLTEEERERIKDFWDESFNDCEDA
ncbi:MAG: hypothetical protein GXO29_02120 [Thermotogae bacterium]|nr:hypothetical protein [Thermotogota bacterium]